MYNSGGMDMKLKFRAEPKDIIIFLIFCVVLLYLVAIAELNLIQFLDDSTLWGFNPFPAFAPNLFAPTMVFYILALIAVITSVSSYFFEREKGFGFKMGKEEKGGYSRWAKDKEMKKELKKVLPNQETSDAAGIPLINNGKEIWVDDGEYHNLVIGATGSGKTQITVLPMVRILAKKGESMIITDPKGEIYEKTANMLREKGYNIVLLNFRDPQKGNAWNPFSLPYSLYKEGNQDKANELLDDLAANILYDEKSQAQDPFWEKTSADYFAGLGLALFEDAKEDEINLNSINLMSTVGEEKYAGTIYMKEYFSTKDPASPTYINVSSALNAPNETKGSILSVFRQKIKLFSSRENLSEMLSHNDFDMKDIGRKKTAVFIIIQDEKKTYHSLATIFIKQCYETLIDVAQESGGSLPYRTNFILDEFANMPPLKDVTTMVTAARSRAIRFTFIIQNFAQLYQVYGKENGETIKGNCGNIIYLISSELSALEEISKMCGEVKSKEKDKTASTPLITVSDLQRLKPGQTIILRTRMMPFKTKMTYDYQMNWGKQYEKATYPQREKQPVHLFDLKAVVEKQHQKKMDELFGNMTSSMGISSGSMGTPVGRIDPVQRPVTSGMPGVPRMPSMPTNSFDVDELVKRIDAKIAELEEEERREKEEEEKKKQQELQAQSAVVEKETTIPAPAPSSNVASPSSMAPVEENVSIPDLRLPDVDILNDEDEIPDIPAPIIPEEKITPTTNSSPATPIVEPTPNVVEETSEAMESSDYVTDDQFFDDFFSDDE